MPQRAVVVIQVRLGSTRLPGKALADVAGRPMLAHVAERAAAKLAARITGAPRKVLYERALQLAGKTRARGG